MFERDRVVVARNCICFALQKHLCMSRNSLFPVKISRKTDEILSRKIKVRKVKNKDSRRERETSQKLRHEKLSNEHHIHYTQPPHSPIVLI